MAGAVSSLLQDMAIVLAVAGATTILFNRLRQPVVLGYLLAGLIVGPYTPPFSYVHDGESLTLLGELGVIFLLFGLGLEFNFRKLRKVGATALVSGTLQVALMIWLGYVVGRAFGLAPLESIFLGAIVSISSTVIIVKVVSELGQKDEEWAQVVFGILIVEDVLAVLMLTLLGAAGSAGEVSTFEVATLLAKFGAFVAVVLVMGLLVVPRLVDHVSRLGLADVLVVTVIALGFGLAVVGGLLGFSPALGAFLMGALIAESSVQHLVEEKVAPLRDLFSAIFFVTVGMLVDPAAILAHWPLILAVTAAVILGKIVAGTFATFLSGRPPETSLRVGFGLAQVGEFSFILAALALSLGVTDAPLYVVSVSAAGVTAFTTPYLIRASPRVARGFQRIAPAPIRTYASLYGAWTRRLHELGASHPARRKAMKAGLRTALFGATGIALVVLGAASIHRVEEALARQAQVGEAALLLGWVAVGLAALPFALLYARAQREFAEALADASLPEQLVRSEQAEGVRRVLVRTFYFGGLVAASALLLLSTSPFIPTAPVVGLVLLTLAVAGALLYRALARFHARVDETLRGVFGERGEATPEEDAGRREVLQLIREQYPWAPGVKEVVLPQRAVSAPVTIRRLHLRGRTGASIVAIHRAGQSILNPPPDAPLLPGDGVVLMGSPEQLDAAGRVLEEEALGAAPAEAPVARALRLPEGSAWVGKSLVALRLRDRVGVSVVAVERAGRRLANPDPAMVLEAGDVVTLVGTPTQHERAQALSDPNALA